MKEEEDWEEEDLGNTLLNVFKVFDSIDTANLLSLLALSVIAQTIMMMKKKARVRLPSVVLENVPVVYGPSLDAMIGLKNTPPPPSGITDVNDPRIPKMLFLFSYPFQNPFTGVGMQYDLDVFFIRQNRIVDKTLLVRNTRYTPRAFYDTVLEVYHDPALNVSAEIGDIVEITIL